MRERSDTKAKTTDHGHWPLKLKIMELYITRNSDNKIFEVRKYVKSGDSIPEQSVWCDKWYGRHVIGQDCHWNELTEKYWED